MFKLTQYAVDILMHGENLGYGHGVAHDDNPPGRGSGRWGFGTGKNPYQHGKAPSLLQRIADAKRDHPEMGEGELAEYLGFKSSKYLRAAERYEKHKIRNANIARARELSEKGMGASEICREMGLPASKESTVRGWLDETKNQKLANSAATVEFLKQQIAEKGVIDIGAMVAQEIGVTQTTLDDALYELELEGYAIGGGRVKQQTNAGMLTTMKVIGPPGMTPKELSRIIYQEPQKIQTIIDYETPDNGETYQPKWVYPASLDSKRLQIVYAEDGGTDRDGLIELRRGCPDLSLGDSQYSQVRILVDGDRYLKGMAVYSDDLPEGVDVRFNTSKHKDKSMREVLKTIGPDKNNPFGSLLKTIEEGGQYYYTDENGERKLGLINKKSDEGDWADWKDKLPSQFLGKQPISLINQQLRLTSADSDAELKDILEVNNPTIRRQLLMDYAESCDSDAVHLQASQLPGQKYQVLLPVPSMKDNEVYAPNFKDGSTIALVRYPHGGIFEIPILKVNNRNPEAIKMMGDRPKDAIGINPTNAGILSGADFDGDTAMCIPCNEEGLVTIKNRKQLPGLEGFDPKQVYGGKPAGTFKVMNKGQQTQTQMGIASNLITDMTLKGAKDDEMVRAVKFSMVVIDAAKHKLDWQTAEKELGIKELKKLYQTHTDPITGEQKGGASTLLSLAKKEFKVPKREGGPQYNDDGSVWYKTAPDEKRFWTDKDGKVHERQDKSNYMSEVDDAFKLSSGTKKEASYAEFANHMKANANAARKEALATPNMQTNAAAKEMYREQLNSLREKLRQSEMNRPRERRAQVLASIEVKAAIADNPVLGTDAMRSELKKVKQRALTSARDRVGAKRKAIVIDDKEWAAIQGGAVSDTLLRGILNYADMDELRKRANPRGYGEISTAKQNRIKAYARNGYTPEQIAAALGVSKSTVEKYSK